MTSSPPDLFEELVNVRQRIRSQRDEFADLFRHDHFGPNNFDLAGLLYQTLSRQLEIHKDNDELKDQPWHLLRNIVLDMAEDGHGDVSLGLLLKAHTIPNHPLPEHIAQNFNDLYDRIQKTGKVEEIQELIDSSKLTEAERKLKEFQQQETDPDTLKLVSTSLDEIENEKKRQNRFRHIGLGFIAALIALIFAYNLTHNGFSLNTESGVQQPSAQSSEPFTPQEARWCMISQTLYHNMTGFIDKESPLVQAVYKEAVKDYLARCGNTQRLTDDIKRKVSAGLMGNNFHKETNAVLQAWRGASSK